MKFSLWSYETDYVWDCFHLQLIITSSITSSISTFSQLFRNCFHEFNLPTPGAGMLHHQRQILGKNRSSIWKFGTPGLRVLLMFCSSISSQLGHILAGRATTVKSLSPRELSLKERLSNSQVSGMTWTIASNYSLRQSSLMLSFNLCQIRESREHLLRRPFMVDDREVIEGDVVPWFM